MKLTDKVIAQVKIPPGKSEHFVWDDNVKGFGFRARREGSRVWIYQHGKDPRITIGKASAIGARQAREIAKSHYARVALGERPWEDKRVQRERAAETFGGVLLKRYLAHKRAELKPRTYQEVERHLLTHARPLHVRPVDAIDQ